MKVVTLFVEEGHTINYHKKDDTKRLNHLLGYSITLAHSMYASTLLQ